MEPPGETGIARGPAPDGPRRQGESVWEWLQRSTHHEPIRRGLLLLSRWVDDLPAAQQAEIRRRLESSTDTDHASAVFEVYLHALLTATGYQVEMDPEAPEGSRPDLRVSLEGRPRCYLEATVNHGDEEVTARDEATYWLLESASRKIVVPGFQILVEGFEVGAQNPAPRQFAGFLNNWFRSVDDSAMLAARRADGLSRMPVREFTDESGWRVTVRLCPLEDAATIPPRVQASWGDNTVRYLDPTGEIRKAVQGKLKQHRRLDLPLVIAYAANDLLLKPSDNDVAAAVLGTEAYLVEAERMCRKGDGLWRKPADGSVPRPAALFVALSCRVDALPELGGVCLWENPFLLEPTLPRWKLPRVARTEQDACALHLLPGCTPSELLVGGAA